MCRQDTRKCLVLSTRSDRSLRTQPQLGQFAQGSPPSVEVSETDLMVGLERPLAVLSAGCGRAFTFDSLLMRSDGRAPPLPPDPAPFMFDGLDLLYWRSSAPPAITPACAVNTGRTIQ